MYKRKTRDEFEIQGDHGFGWELETTEVTRKAARNNLKAYRENAPKGRYRIKVQRVLINPAGVHNGYTRSQAR